jgi:integrase
VDERVLSAYLARLRTLPREPGTIAGHLAYLRAALRWAAGQGLIPKAPRMPKVKVPKRSAIRSITLEEFERLLAKVPAVVGAAVDGWRAYLWVLWHTGMRRTEALELRWDDQQDAAWVDLARKRIVIPAASCKADADSWLPIHDDLRPILQERRQARGRCFDLTSREPSRVSRIFGRVAQAAGVRCTLHDLRRTFGTRYAPRVPAQVLHRLMRHSSISTTMAFYVNLDDALVQAIHAAP